MSYFQRLVVENFQSHEYTEIDFVAGLNVLVGPSDSGKSSVLRALRWVLFNQPRGHDFIREGTEQCQVSLTLMDGTEIIRLRGKKKALNRYILRHPDQKEQVLESLGSGPHPLVLQAHGIVPLDDDTYVQIGSQLDPPFLLSESGGKKAHLIGRISGAHWIDLALKDTKQERYQLQARLRQLEQQEQEVSEKLVPYAGLPQLEERVGAASTLFAVLQQKRQRLRLLRTYRKRDLQLREDLQQVRDTLTRYASIPVLEQRMFSCEQKHWLLIQWQQIQQRCLSLQQQRLVYQRQLERTIHVSRAEKSLDRLTEQMSRVAQLQKLHASWQQYSQEQVKYGHTYQQGEQLPELSKQLLRLEGVFQRVKELKGLSTNYSPLKKLKQEVENRIHQTEFSTEWNNRLSVWDGWQQQITAMKKMAMQYQETQARLHIGRHFILENQATIERLSEQYGDLLEQLGRCPTCGAAAHEASLEHVLG